MKELEMAWCFSAEAEILSLNDSMTDCFTRVFTVYVQVGCLHNRLVRAADSLLSKHSNIFKLKQYEIL